MKKIIVIFALFTAFLVPVKAMAEGEITESTDAGVGYENFFEEMFDAARVYLPEILSVMTLGVSVILAFAFKKGLLPTLSKSLGAIGEAVTHIKDKGESGGELIEKLNKAISTGLADIERTLEEFSVELEALRASLDAAERRAGDREKLSLLINAQIDMLYEVFMSSSLPHYQKEAIGERIAAMKEAIGGNDSE